MLRLILEPSSPQGSSHNPQFTVARRLEATNGPRGALSPYDGTRTSSNRWETCARSADHSGTVTLTSAAGGSRSVISVVLPERTTTRFFQSENMPCQ